MMSAWNHLLNQHVAPFPVLFYTVRPAMRLVVGDIFLSSDEGFYPFCAMLCMIDKRLVRGSEARPILTVYLKKLDNQPETFQQNVIERERFRSLR